MKGNKKKIVIQIVLISFMFSIIQTILLAIFEWRGNPPIDQDEYIPTLLSFWVIDAIVLSLSYLFRK